MNKLPEVSFTGRMEILWVQEQAKVEEITIRKYSQLSTVLLQGGGTREVRKGGGGRKEDRR